MKTFWISGVLLSLLLSVGAKADIVTDTLDSVFGKPKDAHQKRQEESESYRAHIHNQANAEIEKRNFVLRQISEFTKTMKAASDEVNSVAVCMQKSASLQSEEMKRCLALMEKAFSDLDGFWKKGISIRDSLAGSPVPIQNWMNESDRSLTRLVTFRGLLLHELTAFRPRVAKLLNATYQVEMIELMKTERDKTACELLSDSVASRLDRASGLAGMGGMIGNPWYFHLVKNMLQEAKDRINVYSTRCSQAQVQEAWTVHKKIEADCNEVFARHNDDEMLANGCSLLKPDAPAEIKAGCEKRIKSLEFYYALHTVLVRGGK